MSQTPPSIHNEKRHEKHEKAIVLDTLTTRFLMLFLIVLIIPLLSLNFFTQNILEQELENTLNKTIQQNKTLFKSHLTQTHTIQHAIIQHAIHTTQNTDRPVTPTLCRNQPSTLCIRINLQNKTVQTVSTNEFSEPSSNTQTFKHFFSIHPDLKEQITHTTQDKLNSFTLWNNAFYALSLQKSSPTQWIVMGKRLDPHFLSSFFHHNPQLQSHICIITQQALKNAARETPHCLLLGGSEQQADLHPDTLPSIIRSSNTAKPNGNYRFIEQPLYSSAEQSIGRIVYILPQQPQQILRQIYRVGTYGIMLAGLLFSAMVAMVASRSITQPLLQFIQQVTTLSHNKNLSQRVNTKGIHEITQLGKAFNDMLQTMEQEHRQRDEFVATLTHDLKVPLLAEKQTLSYLERGTYGALTDTQKKIATALRSANASNLSLVNGLLEVYRYESGQINLMFENVFITPILNDVISELRPLAAEKQMELIAINPLTTKANATVWADKLDLKRVLTNLMSNAITNTPRNGRVFCLVHNADSLGKTTFEHISSHEFSTERRLKNIQNKLLISVQDSGLGFATEDLPHLFNRFAANRGRNPMSIGLGLYNCYQVIQAHHGTLWVESTEGEGSAVSFLLPQPTNESNRKKSHNPEMLS